MLHEEGYRKRWEKKLEWYHTHDILPHEMDGCEKGILIITQDPRERYPGIEPTNPLETAASALRLRLGLATSLVFASKGNGFSPLGGFNI